MGTTAMAEKTSALRFETYEWDFGNVDAARGTVCHTFRFKNVSKTPVKIEKTNPSCECITARCPKDAVKPGEEAEVMVAFAPKNAE